MSPSLLLAVCGSILGLGVAVLLAGFMPRTIRAGDALDRLGQTATGAVLGAPTTEKKNNSARMGEWIHRHTPDIPGFTVPKKQLDLIQLPVERFYAQKFEYAVIGLIAPLVLPILLQVLLGITFTLPLLLSPVFAFIMWTIPEQNVRARAKAAQREFTRFVATYLELVAVALMGNATADSALQSAANLSDSWVFRRIRREYRIADLTRVSKWTALEDLGETVGVPALTEMARMLRQAEARIGLRDQLRAACNKLRAQSASDDREAAQAVTSRMDFPIYLSLIPIMMLVLVPTILQLAG
ncbi:hypothetical protein [Leifsonia shinshuensis]